MNHQNDPLTYPVAVLMPVFNQTDALLTSIASFDIDFPAYFLLVDDGSTPPIQLDSNICTPHHIQIYRKDKNSGIEESLALGVEHLHHLGFEYIARMDAGDLAHPGRLRTQYEYLRAHDDCAWVGGAVDVIDSQTRAFLYHLSPPLQHQKIYQKIFWRNVYAHPALMLKTSAVLMAGNYQKKYQAAEDMDLLLRLMTKGYQGANVAHTVLSYEVNPKGLSAQKRRVQVLSTRALLYQYKNLKNIYWYLGWLKNTLHGYVPFGILQKLKRFLFTLG